MSEYVSFTIECGRRPARDLYVRRVVRQSAFAGDHAVISLNGATGPHLADGYCACGFMVTEAASIGEAFRAIELHRAEIEVTTARNALT